MDLALRELALGELELEVSGPQASAQALDPQSPASKVMDLASKAPSKVADETAQRFSNTISICNHHPDREPLPAPSLSLLDPFAAAMVDLFAVVKSSATVVVDPEGLRHQGGMA